MKILVPTDFSDSSILALQLAHQIAVQQGGKVTLLHVLDFPVLDGDKIELDITEAVDRLETLAEEKISVVLQRLSFGNEVASKVLVGRRLKTILAQSIKGNYDLMVLGTSKVNSIGAYLFGTFTDKLVHKSELPVLVTRGEVDFIGINQIVMGSAMRLKNDEIIERVQTIRKLSEGSLEVVRINTPSDFMSQDYFDEQVEQLKPLDGMANCQFTSINFKNPADGLIYQAAKSKADLIVIGDKRRSTFRRLMVGEDLAEKVMDYSNLPVLIL